MNLTEQKTMHGRVFLLPHPGEGETLNAPGCITTVRHHLTGVDGSLVTLEFQRPALLKAVQVIGPGELRAIHEGNRALALGATFWQAPLVLDTAEAVSVDVRHGESPCQLAVHWELVERVQWARPPSDVVGELHRRLEALEAQRRR
jgi:hypothetical protein